MFTSRYSGLPQEEEGFHTLGLDWLAGIVRGSETASGMICVARVYRTMLQKMTQVKVTGPKKLAQTWA